MRTTQGLRSKTKAQIKKSGYEGVKRQLQTHHKLQQRHARNQIAMAAENERRKLEQNADSTNWLTLHHHSSKLHQTKLPGRVRKWRGAKAAPHKHLRAHSRQRLDTGKGVSDKKLGCPDLTGAFLYSLDLSEASTDKAELAPTAYRQQQAQTEP
jgi:hypothetical protein